MWFTYLLQSNEGDTYIGATVNPFHRLRQHNCEITGGAKWTTTKVNPTNKWRILCYVSGFPTQHDALQFEWMWEHTSRPKRGRKRGIKPEKRFLALHDILNLGKSTLTSDLFVNYQSRAGYYPQVHMAT